MKELRSIVENANKSVQQQSNEILSTLVSSSVGFGYPNSEELQLGVTTQLSIDEQIKIKRNFLTQQVQVRKAFPANTTDWDIKI